MQLWVLAKDNGVPALGPDRSSACHCCGVATCLPTALREGVLDPPVGALPGPGPALSPCPWPTCVSPLFLACVTLWPFLSSADSGGAGNAPAGDGVRGEVLLCPGCPPLDSGAALGQPPGGNT